MKIRQNIVVLGLMSLSLASCAGNSIDSADYEDQNLSDVSGQESSTLTGTGDGTGSTEETNGNGEGSKTEEPFVASATTIRFHPFELVDSQLSSVMGLAANNAARSSLANQRLLFGAMPTDGTPRNLSFSVARWRAWMDIANTACSTANPVTIFPQGSLNAEPLWKAMAGTAPTQRVLDGFAKALAELETVQLELKQASLCMLVLNDLRSQSDV